MSCPDSLLVTEGAPSGRARWLASPDETRLFVRFRGWLEPLLAGSDPLWKTPKINPKTEENFRLPKTWSLSTTIMTRFTTIQPSKNHVQAPCFLKTPRKNNKTPPKLKTVLEKGIGTRIQLIKRCTLSATNGQFAMICWQRTNPRCTVIRSRIIQWVSSRFVIPTQTDRIT